MSEVRGSSLDCRAATAQGWPRGAALHPRSGAAAERSYPVSEASGSREETPCVRDQGRPGEATLRPRPGVVTLRSHPRPRPGPVAGRSNPRSGGRAGTGGPRGAIPC